MNIGMVVDNIFSGDIRVENEVQALTKAGFQVFVLCLNFGKSKSQEDYHSAKIYRENFSKNTYKKVKALANTPLDYHKYYWARKIKKFIRQHNIDVLHLHDLFMFSSGIKARKQLKKELILVGDLHENYPAGLKHYRFSTTFPGNILISIPKWERDEVKYIKAIDHAITVIEEATERYVALGIDRKKFTVVANYLNLNEFAQAEDSIDVLERFKKHFVITYVGGFDYHRGIDIMIKSIPHIKDEIINLKVLLIGDGKNINDLKALADNLSVSEFISFEGYQPIEIVPSYIKASNICIIPHLKTEHTDNTIPHKLFQYMYLERPVISSDCDPIVRILNETGAGLTYRFNDEKDLASRIFQVYNDQVLAVNMGEKGKDAVLKKYNWEATSRELISLYKKIEKSLS